MLLGAGARSGTPFTGPKQVENWTSANRRGLSPHPPFMETRGLEPEFIDDADKRDKTSRALSLEEQKFRAKEFIKDLENLISEMYLDLECLSNYPNCRFNFEWNGTDKEIREHIKIMIKAVEDKLREQYDLLRRLG
jgi:hypothetical protein